MERVVGINGKRHVENWGSDTLLTSTQRIERVTGRKARGLQMEEIGCKCQTFFSLLSGRKKQTSDIFFLLYTNLKGFS